MIGGSKLKFIGKNAEDSIAKARTTAEKARAQFEAAGQQANVEISKQLDGINALSDVIAQKRERADVLDGLAVAAAKANDWLARL